ncbi:MAG: dihydroneopterin aldolase [bacterium]
MTKDTLKLKNMTFHAFHGVWDEEREIGQRFEVDVEIKVDALHVSKTDKLKDTIDLTSVYEKVKSVVLRDRYLLVETMAEKIARQLMHAFEIPELVVRVRKPHAPIRGIQDGIEVEIVRTKDSYINEL